MISNLQYVKQCRIHLTFQKKIQTWLNNFLGYDSVSIQIYFQISSPPPPLLNMTSFLGWVELKKGEYWGKGKYSTVVGLSTSCSPLKIKEWRVVPVWKQRIVFLSQFVVLSIIICVPILVRDTSRTRRSWHVNKVSTTTNQKSDTETVVAFKADKNDRWIANKLPRGIINFKTLERSYSQPLQPEHKAV